MAISVEDLRDTLGEQHRRIKTLIEDVLARKGPAREEAFDALRRFLAAHEAAEKECMHLPALEGLNGETREVVQRVEEEEEAGKVMGELERLGTASPEFPAQFEAFRQAVISHAEAEEREELPRLVKPFDDSERARLQRALSQVPDLASRNGDSGTSFTERLQAARAEFRSGAPTARWRSWQYTDG